MIGYILLSDCGKFYVGITKNFQRRVREHKCRGPMSSEGFVVFQIFEFSDRQVASAWEVSEIKNRGIENLLNRSLGDYGGRKRACLAPERERLSVLATERYRHPENRAKTGRSVSEAFKRPECRKLRSEAAKAACSRPEVKVKRSVAQKATWADPEIRARRLRALKVANSDPAKAEQRSLAAKKRWESRRARA